MCTCTCVCADLQLDSLHARAERRVGLPSGAGTAKEMAEPMWGICIAKPYVTDAHLS